MDKRGSVAIVGAGDFIGSAIARTFAGAGYAVHGGRRGGEKLKLLQDEIAAAGGRFTGTPSTLGRRKRLLAFLMRRTRRMRRSKL